MRDDGAHTPGPEPAVVKWLVEERDVHGFGTETIGTDYGQGQHFNPPYPAHFYMHGKGRYGLQCLTNLDQLPARGSVIFAAPLKICLLYITAIRLLSTIERHNAFAEDPVQVRGGWAMDVGELWAMAGVKPGDMDFVETYDDYPVISMLQFEDLGFCAKGEGPDFVREHSLTNDGTFPHNTSGGQLSAGQAGAAGGFLGLTEAMRQLAGTPIGKPVPEAKLCVVSGFGMINYDRGLSSGAAVLARAA